MKPVEDTLDIDSINDLPPGETCKMYVRAKKVFKATELCIEQDVAECFEFYDIRVGCIPQVEMSKSSPVQATAFLANPKVKFDVLQEQQDITFILKNKSKAPKRFKARFNGYSLDI